MSGVALTKGQKKVVEVVKIAFIFMVAIMIIAPFYISVVYALRESGEIALNRLSWPDHPTLENFKLVITENEQFLIGFKNSVLTTVPAVIILTIVTSMASYVLARFQNRFYRIVYMIFISGMLIPIQCIMLPLYLNFFNLNLTNSNLGFVIARTGLQLPISILVVTGFVKSVPRELEEAATIDGCNRFVMFWRVVFPLMKPVNATQLVLNALFIWNDYTTSVILLRKPEARTLVLAQMSYFNEYTSQLNLAFAFFILAMLPILILYFCMQKYIVRGIMMGAVKG